jgi:hypothetical protein
MHVHMADTRPHLFGCGLMRVGCLHFLCGLVRKCFIFSHPTGILQKVSKSYKKLMWQTVDLANSFACVDRVKPENVSILKQSMNTGQVDLEPNPQIQV